MAARLLLVAAFANAALAYSNTGPVVAWASSSSYALDSLPSRLDSDAHSASLLESILSSDDICKHDAILLVEQPGLHASDLRRLSPDAHLHSKLSSSYSARQYPYIPNHHGGIGDTLSSVLESVSSRCNSRLLKHYSPEHTELEHGVKHVLSMTLPHLSESGSARMSAMDHHDKSLASALSSLSASCPDHLVIYTGSPHPASHKRQESDVPDRPSLDFSSVSSSFAPTNTTLPAGGILKRYQLLTPGLITGLLVAFFILIPIVLGGMNALASIQNPVRTDVSKSFNAQERKNQ
ncbi:hypothetical protein CPC08DRAFT_673070 [Agrocybe pediades]|nr:hypothetical protein CPC08DRAFT_673070 [Agrocybe pediades]